MRALLALLAVLLFGCSEPQPEDQSFIDGLLERTAQVFVSCPDGDGTGTAVFLDTVQGGAVAATAAHVAEPGCDIKIQGTPYLIASRDEAADIAILWSPHGPAFRTLEAHDPWLGQSVVAIGYPRQGWDGNTALQVTRGNLSSFLSNRYKITAPVYFGSSGGPVFDARGRLVGLVTNLGTFRGVPHAGEYFITAASQVYEMSRRFTKNFRFDELACKCGVPVPERYYDNALAITKRAQKLRDVTGSPLYVVSGYRTPDYNRKVGGAPGSHHMTASALDLRSWTHPPQELAALYEELIASGEVPDGGLGVYDRWIHIDLGKPRRWRD